MARQTVIQESFSAGAVTPFVYGRYSSDGYQQGCKDLENMIPDSHGPAMSRDGTNFIQEFDGNDGRIFSMQADRNFFYSVIVLDLKIVIGSMFGQVPATNYVVNSHFHDGSSNWTDADTGLPSYVSYADHLGRLHVQSSPNKYARVGQQITVPSSGNYKVLVNTAGGATYDVWIGTAFADSTYHAFTGINASEEFDITVPGTSFWITINNDSNASYDDVDISLIAVSDAVVTNPEFVTPWEEEELNELQIIPVPDGFSAYMVHPNHPVQKLVYDPGTDAFTFNQPVFTSPPTEWTTGNHPSTGVYFQGRLWLASTPEHRQHIWGSKSGLPEDMTVGTGLDDEAIVIILESFGGIEWMAATKNLLAGTESGEHIISSTGGLLTPSDHQVTQQSAYGSANVRAVQVGDQVFYVSADGRKLRAMQYEWSSDNWLSSDLTYFSSHITHDKIKATAWLQNPGNLFVCLLEDGHFAALSYDRSNNIYGWSHHNINDDCIDVSVGTVQGTSILGVLVARADGKLYYESQALIQNRYMDSWVEQFFDPPVSVVTGLDHLEGRVVKVMANDAVHPDRTVSSGQITLNVEVGKVLVGLGYSAKLTLLPFEKGAAGGPSNPYWKNLYKLHAHLWNSAHPLINGRRASDRTPSTPMDTPEPLISGKSYINLTEWKNETDIVIEQDLPLPITILAVSGEINQEKL